MGVNNQSTLYECMKIRIMEPIKNCKRKNKGTANYMHVQKYHNGTHLYN
jgi:hypothetical protein